MARYAVSCQGSYPVGKGAWLQSELTLSRVPVDDWFAHARERYGLQQYDGCCLVVDFEIGRICLAGSTCKLPDDDRGQQEQASLPEKPVYAVHLAEMDLHCIQSLVELRDSLVDEFRTDYSCAGDFHQSIDTAGALVQQIGDIQHSIDAWYHEKATGLGWPTTATWSIDLDESTLMLTLRDSAPRVHTALHAERT